MRVRGGRERFVLCIAAAFILGFEMREERKVGLGWAGLGWVTAVGTWLFYYIHVYDSDERMVWLMIHIHKSINPDQES